MTEGLFYLLSLGLLSSSLSVAWSRYPVYSILSLMASFLITSILWLNLSAEFLALALVFVYVGAVMVLFLFMVFMLNANEQDPIPLISKGIAMLSIGIGVYYLSTRLRVIPSGESGVSTVSNTYAIGTLLYRKYVYAFEVMGCVLLAAMISVIRMMVPARSRVKKQDPRTQMNREPKDCVTWM